MTTFTSDNFGINTVSGSLLGNQYLNLAAQLTDDDLLNSEEIQIDWPSTDSRLNHCTVKFFNESENFKEDSASWPPKVSGTIFKGIGGKLYKPQSGWDDTGSSTARLLNNLAVWGGTATDGADNTPPMSWAFAASASDSCTLEIAGDDSITVILYNITNELDPVVVANLSATFPNTNFLANIQLVLNTKYRIVVYGNDTGSLQGVAGRLYGTTSNIEYWSTRAIAYDSIEIQNQLNFIYTYFLEQDNGVELEDSVNMDGIVDYYHALAKAEERVRTSRSAISVKFKYIIKNKFLEPGDYIRLDSVRASLENLYLRIDEVSLEDGATCSVTATRFDWTQLAWNVKDDQLILPANIYNFNTDAPTNLSLNNADTTLEGTVGKLSWNGVNSEVTGYIVYIAEVQNNQIGPYQEIGRTNLTNFSVPAFNYSSVAFGVQSYTAFGKKSDLVSTGILQISQNYKRDLYISANHLMFIQEPYTTNFTTPAIVLTAVPRGFSNPSYQWYQDNQLISGNNVSILEIQPFLGIPRNYKVRVTEYKPGNNTPVQYLEYSVVVQSRKEETRSDIVVNPSLPPPAPTNFDIEPLYNSIKLSWTIPTYTEGGGHGYTDIYYIESESLENWDAIITGILQAATNQEPGNTIFKELFNLRRLGDINNTGDVTSADSAAVNNFVYLGNNSNSFYINRTFRPILQSNLSKYQVYLRYTVAQLAVLEASVVKIASVQGNVNNYIFSGNPNTNYIFFLKEVSREGVESINKSIWLSATTGIDATKVLETLSGEITASQLNTTLNTRIDKIDAPNTGLETLVSNLTTQSNGFASNISTLQAADTTLQANITTEVNARIAGDNANATSITTLSASLPSITQYGDGFYYKLIYNFDTSTESFTGSNTSLSITSQYGPNTLLVYAYNFSTYTVALNKTFTTSERFNGSTYPIIRIRLKRTQGDSNIAFLGEMRYSTASHSSMNTYAKIISLPPNVVLNSTMTDWFVAEWDMSSLTSGGSDWVNSTIYGIQLLLHNSQYAIWAIDWIAIGSKSVTLADALYRNEVIARTNADNSLSSSITTLQSNYNGLSVSLQQKMTTRASADGTTLGEYSLVVDNNGIVSGFALASSVNTATGAANSTFGINADKFFIATPGNTANTVKPFIVDSGVVYIDVARIKDGSIANAKIGNLSADKITSGFINVDRLDANSITAPKIDSKGLSIKDANGNILFNANSSQPLAAAAVSGLGTLATQNSVAYSAITGTKPPEDATKGAPAGTLVGDTLAETVVSNASSALSTANTANTTANAASTNATTALNLLNDISSDNKLTAVEKQQLKIQFDAIVAEKSNINTQATSFGVTTENTNYNNSYTTLINYLTPLLTDLTITSDIVGSTLRTNFTDFYTKRQILLNKLSEIANSNATTANATANAATTTANSATTTANAASTAATNATATANAANITATTANNTANAASSNALTALNLLNDIASDNKLTAIEKQQLKIQFDAIVSEKSSINTQATSFGITTENTNYNNSYTTLIDYLTPLLTSLTATSDITGSTLRTNFTDFYTKRQLLLNKIAEVANTNATNATATANAANATATTANTNATNAATLADTANTTANTANTTANTANTTANTALSTANTASTNATNALNGLANKLDNNARNVLSGPGGFATGDLNWDANGVRVSGKGIGFTTKGIVAYNAAGDATFTLNGDNGSAVFKGDITGASGNFSGTLSGANIAGATGTFTGIVSANSIQGNTITTQKIVGGAVTQVESFSDFSTFFFNSTQGWVDIASLTIQDPDPTGEFNSITIIFSIRFSRPGFSSTDVQGGYYRVLRNNTEVFPLYGNTGDSVLSEVFKYSGGGTATFKLQVQMPVISGLGTLRGSVIRRSLVLIGTRR